ncbi:hypothetical protein BCIN_03g01530 [Botrytis cinerea B05.10]|uniref:Zn(2)-C6 fungal-type domain-containing protein n=3 Tax=Botryotinia fuckeliana TaxID=40559 RepID=A0A384JBN3_BOTFB|nr:hypothetical protein BCIN_03g01530 [Botrytis cinerea B05.10]ATZ47872.1 hypothetical protein BCIN_03g01530 [Botrytis cinerea B05.10]EMR87200.1 putative fungal specific transcription factor domain-containing protein [Botrytis cinerea BcDW1]CCD43955.1 similar to transcription factor Cys6 [Botrytis cinerea T4]
MFTTFVSMPSTTPSTSASPEPPPRPRPRQKRSQVAKACDWCRVHRIKCDNDHPCNNCKTRGGNCSNSGALKSATLPHAYREIERLKQKVQELEKELEKERSSDSKQNMQMLPPHGIPSPPNSIGSSRSGHDTGLSGMSGLAVMSGLEFDANSIKREWEGIHISTARSPQKTWYGSASLYYFIGRLNTFLTASLHQKHSAHAMLPNSASKVLDGPTTADTSDNKNGMMVPIEDPLNVGDYLSPTQEEYFLGLFWQSYYTSNPIIDEQEFKEHYQSLWMNSDKERKPSALVDIILAMCMQYGMSFLPNVTRAHNPGSRANVNVNDATIAGRWHYRRCQSLLAADLEAPTIATLQCHILCSIYLCCGSFQNMADSACSAAVRTAYMLGLHVEPPQEMPRKERELRKRMWWTLYVLESKMSMKLGRPFLVHECNTTCTLPTDDRDVAIAAGQSFAPLGDNVTWLTWNLHNTKLLLVARSAYSAFYDTPVPNTVSVRGTIWDDLQTLGTYADMLEPHLERMDEWLRGVPMALKTDRLNGGSPFSTDLSHINIEPFAPLWLQRQRLLLELMYHNLSTNLCRPFIIFNPGSTPTALSEQIALKCVGHAMQLTHIMHHVILSTSILAGWQESFQWQWNCAMTLVGYIFAYPQGTQTRAARGALDLAIAVFDNFGNNFAQAASAANVMTELSAKVDIRLAQTYEKQMMAQQSKVMTKPDEVQSVMSAGDSGYESLLDDSFTGMQGVDSLSFDNETNAEIQDILAQSIDMTFPADSYTDFEMLWANMGTIFPE